MKALTYTIAIVNSTTEHTMNAPKIMIDGKQETLIDINGEGILSDCEDETVVIVVDEQSASAEWNHSSARAFVMLMVEDAATLLSDERAAQALNLLERGELGQAGLIAHPLHAELTARADNNAAAWLNPATHAESQPLVDAMNAAGVLANACNRNPFEAAARGVCLALALRIRTPEQYSRALAVILTAK